MLDFAETVFGEEFPDDAVITESRLSHRRVGSAVTAERTAGSGLDCRIDRTRWRDRAAQSAAEQQPGGAERWTVARRALDDSRRLPDAASRWPTATR